MDFEDKDAKLKIVNATREAHDTRGPCPAVPRRVLRVRGHVCGLRGKHLLHDCSGR